MLRLCFFIYFTSIIFSAKAQEDKTTDSLSYKKTFYTVNTSILYNIFYSNRHFESHAGTSTTQFNSLEFKNGNGMFLNFGFRHYFQKQFSIQQNLIIGYKAENYEHHDSIKNQNNSILSLARNSIYFLNYSIFADYHFRRFSNLFGIKVPLLSYSYESLIYKDKSISKNGGGFELGDLYISENLQYELLKNKKVIVNFGIDINPSILWDPRGYKTILNAGICCLFERKKKSKKNDDYVK
jgi:hypothetical protein